MTRLPSCLSRVMTLRIIDVSNNMDLQLKHGDMDILLILSTLKSFRIDKRHSGGIFTWESMQTLVSLQVKNPGLYMGLLLHQRPVGP